ncbi:MAG: hypothetical protein ACRDS0_36610 [Pseudonocardiaceae bacterium]
MRRARLQKVSGGGRLAQFDHRHGEVAQGGGDLEVVKWTVPDLVDTRS